MNALRNKRFVALIVSMVITRFIVDYSSLVVLSEGRHIADAFVAVFCFIGVYYSAMGVFTIFSSNNKPSA